MKRTGKNGRQRPSWGCAALALLWLAVAAAGRAAEPAATGPAATNATAQGAPPAGRKILYSGDSWHRLMPMMMAEIGKTAGITGQWVDWNSVADKMKPMLESGQIDVLSWGRPSWSEGLGWVERQGFIESGLKGNPNFRFYLQMAWVVHDGLGNKIATQADYDRSNLTEVQTIIDGARKGVEAQVDAVNKKYGRPVVFLVPLGDAMMKVRGLIAAGAFPGVQQQSQLFSDAMPHPGSIAWALMAYCNYAAVYQRSPVGLTWGGGVTEEQRVILQNIAWETVSKYPYAGIARQEAPAASRTGGKAPPAGVAGEAAVPEALKGWQATRDLPDDVVVTDYNAYIEQLPKEERPGVSDVKYYVDGAGGHAVAVLVNMGSTQWTHLLVYDRQNKRLTLSKSARSR